MRAQSGGTLGDGGCIGVLSPLESCNERPVAQASITAGVRFVRPPLSRTTSPTVTVPLCAVRGVRYNL